MLSRMFIVVMWNTKRVGVDGSSDKEAEGDAVPAVMLHADSSPLTTRTLLLSINKGGQSKDFGGDSYRRFSRRFSGDKSVRESPSRESLLIM
jgi:hypothetical protein